jgi:uracil-DNA glycosylase family 4
MAGTLVPPEGCVETASYIIVGEQPGRIEARVGRPFIGPTGRELNEDLQMIGIARADCYLTNVVKDFDKPIGEYILYNPRKKLATTSATFDEYVEKLYDELRDSTAVIIALGNVALYALTGKWGITKWRGSRVASSLLPGRIVYPTFHPATVLPPKNQFLNKTLIQFDFKKAKREVEGHFEPTKRELIVAPSFNVCMAALNECYDAGLAGNIIDYDIEVMGMDVSREEVSCISFAIPRDIPTAISIPFFKGEDYFTIAQEVAIWLLIAKILENPAIQKRGQNIIFDTHFLLRKYGIKGKNFHDTMIAQRTLMPEFPMGLDFITSLYTDHPYYKADGKKNFGGANWHTLWAYNATDSLICQEAHPKQMEELAQLKTVEAYDRQRALIEPLTYMMERGIRVDVAQFRKRRTELDIEIETLKEELNKVAGKELNANSSKQLCEYFYGQLGQKAYKSRKTGNASTNNLAMKRLARKGFEAAKLVLEIRERIKLATTYLDESKLSNGNRLRCSYNPVGTRFSRLSSSKNIFGEGMNLQNQPHSIRDMLLPDEGYIWYSFDLAQAENRIVAYVGRIDPMIRAFEEGKDVHRLTASLIFNKPPEEISDVAGSSTLGDGRHSERDWGKRSNHGLNYDFGYKSFAILYEMSEREAKYIVESYHKVYPGVRQGFHAHVRRSLRKTRTLTNLMGRRTLFLGPLVDETFKEAYSCIPQGTVGDLINENGLEYIYYDQDQFADVELLTQTHDDIGFQIPLSIGWHEHARILLAIKKSLERPLRVHDYTFKLPADLSIGLTMAKKHGRELKWKGFPETCDSLADKLAEIYAELRAQHEQTGTD